MLERYAPEELISFARRLDPGLEEQDFAETAQRLDQLPDRAFTGLGLSRENIAELRKRFASWPRQAQARREDRAADVSGSADWQVQGVSRTEPAASRGTRQARTDAGPEDLEPEADI